MSNNTGQENQIVIGDSATGNGSNTFTAGDDNITDFYAGENGQAVIHGDGSQLTNLPAGATPTLAEVTAQGNTTTDDILITGSIKGVDTLAIGTTTPESMFHFQESRNFATAIAIFENNFTIAGAQGLSIRQSLNGIREADIQFTTGTDNTLYSYGEVNNYNKLTLNAKGFKFHVHNNFSLHNAVEIDTNSNLTVYGNTTTNALYTAIAVKTSNYTTTANDHTIVCNNGIAITITVHSPTTVTGQMLYFSNVGAGTATITGDYFDDCTNIDLASGGSLILQAVSGKWVPIMSTGATVTGCP